MKRQLLRRVSVIGVLSVAVPLTVTVVARTHTDLSASGDEGPRVNVRGEDASGIGLLGPLRVFATTSELETKHGLEPSGLLEAISRTRTPSCVAHLMLLYGPDELLPGSDVTLLEHLSDSAHCDALAYTRFGPRYVSLRHHLWSRSAKGDSHSNFVLSAFAQVGVPASHRIRVGDREGTVEDAVFASAMNVRLGDQELAWTAIALAHYHPEGKWRNHLDEPISLDMICFELMRRGGEERACRGLHRLQALHAMVVRGARSSSRALAPETRSSILAYLKRKLTLAAASQRLDGGWSLGWDAGASDVASSGGVALSDNTPFDILATGHTLEWLASLDGELRPSGDVLHRAQLALVSMLQTSKEKLSTSVCAHTHAYRSLCGTAAWGSPSLRVTGG